MATQKLLRKTAWAVLAVCLLVVLVWAANLGWHGYSLWRVFQHGRALANDGWQSVSLQAAAGLAAEAAPHLNAVRRDLRPLYPVLRLADALPGKAALLPQAEPGLEMGTELLNAGVDLIAVFAPLLQEDDGQAEAGGPSLPERLVQAVVANPERIQRAEAAVDRAMQYVDRIQPKLYPDTLQDNLDELDEDLPLLQAGVHLLKLLPQLAGADQPQTYLVLAQNNDELRPSGGFISGIGLVRLEGGRIAEFDLSDSYAVDNPSVEYPVPPEPLQRYMLAGYWMPRDANWSPDFPTTAHQVQDLYTLSTGTQVAGVIAFDQYAIASLVKVLGTIPVPGYPDPLTPGNVVSAMRSAWNPGEGQAVNDGWYENRKDFMADMGKAILENLLSVRSPNTTQIVVHTILDNIREGHLLVNLNDSNAQSLLTGLDLDGRVRPGEGDYLMLVDWNFGYNKVDAVTVRSLDYRVDLSDVSNPSGKLTVQYTHNLQEPVECRHEAAYGKVYEDLQRRCLWTYWRVYTGPGTRLTHYTAPPVSGENLLSGSDWNGLLDEWVGEGGAQVFGGPLVLSPGNTAELTFDLSLPVSVVQSDDGLEYFLRIQKQAGLHDQRVSVLVIPPEGYTVAQLPYGWELQGDGYHWGGMSDDGWMWDSQDLVLPFAQQ